MFGPTKYILYYYLDPVALMVEDLTFPGVYELDLVLLRL